MLCFIQIKVGRYIETQIFYNIPTEYIFFLSYTFFKLGIQNQSNSQFNRL